MLFAMLQSRGWLRALGRPQTMVPGQRRLLVLLGAAFVLNSYDLSCSWRAAAWRSWATSLRAAGAIASAAGPC